MEEKGTILSHMEKIIQPIDEEEGGKDIGYGTVKLFKEKIKIAKTIFWNGPLGKIEDERFAKGTEEIARAIIESRAFSVVGGGETIEFINKLNLISQFNHVSTGGGAMLTFLAGEEMPGIEALKWRPNPSKHQVFSEQ
jgi:phosphoglycerate kinase